MYKGTDNVAHEDPYPEHHLDVSVIPRVFWMLYDPPIERAPEVGGWQMTYERLAESPSHPPMNRMLQTWISTLFSVASARIHVPVSPKNSFSDIFCALFGASTSLVS